MLAFERKGRTLRADVVLDHEIVYNYYNRIPIKDREAHFQKAVLLGTLALMEDRFSAFLSRTSDELGVQLESLKRIFDMKQTVFYKTSIKGLIAENDIASFLKDYIEERGLGDDVELASAEAGKLKGNKTGDIISYVNCDRSRRIVIECKFSRSIRMGSIGTSEIGSKTGDTVWSQLLEAQVNREALAGIIVMDRSLTDSSILAEVDNVGYIRGLGFVCIIDSQANNYTNLAVAYMLARDIALKARDLKLDTALLSMIIERVLKDINEIQGIRTLIEDNIENNKLILKRLEKSLLSIEFSEDYIRKFLTDGTITKADLLNFYKRDAIQSKYALLAARIESTYNLEEM